MSSTDMKVGFFSQMQKDNCKMRYDFSSKYPDPISNIYLNENNEEVEVTQICSHETEFNKDLFYDYHKVGIVTKWIKSIYD